MASEQWAYRLTIWLLQHGAVLTPVAIGLCFLVVVACSALLWFQSGARYIWAWRQWQSLFRPSGGAGGHTMLYRRTMQSTGWRRRRAQAIRRAGHRCEECGARGPLDVHHLSYRHLGDERPYELTVLCPACHQAVHRRNAA
jgi:hypothetical protein